MYNNIINNNEANMKKCLELFKKKINIIYINRITPCFLHNIKINLFNKITPIRYLSSITVENANTLKVTPFDTNIIKNIEKAIILANLDINTKIINNSILVIIPIMTESRRIKILQMIKKESEFNRINIRNIRRKTNNHIKILVKNKQISENEEIKLQNIIQKQTIFYIKCISDFLKLKEQNILQH
ncbi:ribosome recycling factor [Enterobacteriaceae endosymbiont of Neohaemonia nigricornis]|uniref:ribosome recycling factor n=1 Tax=Enterobacteriaceae endosymbiont of Neohaemonia nigricornis TaxID=2675792 RepID=UPI0014497264|nr:ribosome recycling factor [Enterobacteriaceae endosymbiont of Neohaemonia nigricornis]QJC30423.1 ribosome recycling factor [Enterobacteriaceae endosymbiont of Neohaemonia nigricornis]